MASYPASGWLSVELTPDEFDIWLAALREAREEVPTGLLTERVGVDWEGTKLLRAKLLEFRADEDEPLRLSITVADADVIRRCLDETIKGLGVDEFDTRVGVTLEEGHRALRRLESLTSRSKQLWEDADGYG